MFRNAETRYYTLLLLLHSESGSSVTARAGSARRGCSTAGCEVLQPLSVPFGGDAYYCRAAAVVRLERAVPHIACTVPSIAVPTSATVGGALTFSRGSSPEELYLDAFGENGKCAGPNEQFHDLQQVYGEHDRKTKGRSWVVPQLSGHVSPKCFGPNGLHRCTRYIVANVCGHRFHTRPAPSGCRCRWRLFLVVFPPPCDARVRGENIKRQRPSEKARVKKIIRMVELCTN